MKNYEEQANIFEEQANIFAENNGIEMTINKVSFGKHFAIDKEYRYIFNITLFRNKKSYTFNYGQSIIKWKEKPVIYDVLACLEKYGYSSFEDFCLELGYDKDCRDIYKMYLRFCEEYEAVNRLFGDILDELREIQ